ncbi:radical SAM protein [Proteinivorax hydrogeniformans]|uniref:Radical SAM protein n=1 Tax=Proteinivorax hydrogeniformans TaxID=1826727 RepID=A0AAU8HRR3_9FIRM
MNYHMPLYRPPSEAKSAIIQVTLGCSHNKCSFCSMYKEKTFTVKSKEEIVNHIDSIAQHQKNASRVFLADGNVLALATNKLLFILQQVRSKFPSLERISCYAGPKDLINKTCEELLQLKAAGLDMLYLGVESGNDAVLAQVEKGVNSSEMVKAGQKAKEAGFLLSTMVISGLGGQNRFYQHAIDSANIISQIDPHYFSVLTLMVEEGTTLQKQVKEGKFKLLTPSQVLEEMVLIITNLNLNKTIFRANHASNYFFLAGVLDEDKDKLLNQLNQIKKSNEFRSENWRGL